MCRRRAWKAFGLTTIRQPVDRLVAAAVDMLVGEIEQGAPSGRVEEVPAELVVPTSARVP